MASNDFYEILGVSKNATEEEIRKSYKKLVIKYHPDRNKNPSASERFRKIQIAYEVLSNNTDRKKYDSFDEMNNSRHLKEMFMYYRELIIDICEKYDLHDKEKIEILSLFDPNDYVDELASGDIHAANYKLSSRIFEYIPQFFCHKIIQHASEYLYSWIY